MQPIDTKKWTVLKVNSKELCLLFIEKFVEHGNAELNLEYVMQCHAILIFKDGKLIGGVIFNAGNQPFRYFSVFHNDDEKMAVLRNENLNEKEIVEITAIWHIKGLSVFDRFIFFLLTYWQAWIYAKSNNRTFMMGGSLIKKVQDYQQKAMKHLVVSMPLDSSTVKHHGNTSKVAKVYGVERRYFLKNVCMLLISDVFSSIWKSVFNKKKRHPKSS